MSTGTRRHHRPTDRRNTSDIAIEHEPGTGDDIPSPGAHEDDPLNDPETRALLTALAGCDTSVRVLCLRRGDDRDPRSRELHDLGRW